MCHGAQKLWIQGFFEDEEWLRAYAMSGAGREAA
jgi:hypothetical protein